MSGDFRPADLNLLQLVDPDYATTPDGRFYAHQGRNGWYVADEQGHYFVGGGKVASLQAADSYVEAWAEQAGARDGEVAAR